MQLLWFLNLILHFWIGRGKFLLVYKAPIRQFQFKNPSHKPISLQTFNYYYIVCFTTIVAGCCCARQTFNSRTHFITNLQKTSSHSCICLLACNWCNNACNYKYMHSYNDAISSTNFEHDRSTCENFMHTEKSFRNLIKLTWNRIVFPIFRLIWSQTDVRLDPDQSKNGKYNLISG